VTGQLGHLVADRLDDGGGPQSALVSVVLVVVLADEVPAGPAVVGGRGGLGEEGQAEGGRRGALLAGGAAVGALPRADGLQHAALPFLQHVLLWRETRSLGGQPLTHTV